MRDGRSRPDGPHSQPISARVTRETREAVERLAEEHYRGKTSVATREAVLGGLAREHHRQAAEHLADRNRELHEQREELREENDDLRARLEDPDVIDWLEVTRNTSGGLWFGLVGVLAVTVGFGVSLLGVWLETVLGATLPGWVLPVTITVALAGFAVILSTVILGALNGIIRARE